MRFKVEQRERVVQYVRHELTAAEQADYFARLEQVRQRPIAESIAVTAPRLSPYMLRGFRFAGHLALFQMDLAQGRITVLSCRRYQPGQNHP